MSKIALITGATSGIGKATADVFAKEGYKLIICGRRMERLEKLCAVWSALTEVHVLRFDVRDNKQVKAAIDSLPKAFQDIDILVNNAGNAHGLSPIQEGDTDDWDLMIDINVKGLLYVSRAVIPQMVARKQGHIINIGSVAGKEVYVNGNVYCASKHAVDALTESMRKDLYTHGIKVTGIHPGLVETEFSVVRYKGDLQRAAKVYAGMIPLKAEDIADTILFTVTRPAHVVLADIVILPTAQGAATLVHRTESMETIA